ncbi:unnamed protein product [Sphagnum jensenii]|uniref:Uncharacterized protein n=2 Tax=Sphagnum jensenii TaxID=128206 RepID=A0ABP0VH22_9BRYO
MLSHNSVEGYRVRMGMFTNDLFSEKVYLYGHAAYGFLDRKWKYEGDAHFMLPTHSNRWHALTLTSKDDMIQLGQENPMLSSDNLLTLLSVRARDTRVMHLRLESVTYERDWFKGLSSNIALSYKHFYTIPGVFNFEQTEPDGSIKDINGISTTEFMGELRYSKDDQYIESYSYRFFVPTTKPSFTFRYTWGIKNPLIGDYGYEKFQGIIKDIIYMPVIGYGKLNVTAGYIAGGVPYPLAFISSSNTSFLKDEFSFQLTNPFEFASDKYVSFWYEQHFEGLLFNHIPYLRLLKLREFISFKALYGDFATSNQQLMSLPDGTHTAAKMPYMEVGFGLENIFKIIQFMPDTWYEKLFLEKGWIDFTILGGTFKEKADKYLSDHSLQNDYMAQKNNYDMTVFCTDLIVPRKLRKTKTVWVQEGMVDEVTPWSKFVRATGVIPRYFAMGTSLNGSSDLCDIYCAASEGYKNFYEEMGTSRDKIVVTGIPNFDNILQYLNNDFPERDYVMVATSDIRECLGKDDRIGFLQRAMEIAGSRKVIFKLHPNEIMDRAIAEIRQVAGPDAIIYTDGKAEHMVANCEELITQFSTLVYVGIGLGKKVHSYFDLEDLHHLMPEQNGGRSARKIAEICRSYMDFDGDGRQFLRQHKEVNTLIAA